MNLPLTGILLCMNHHMFYYYYFSFHHIYLVDIKIEIMESKLLLSLLLSGITVRWRDDFVIFFSNSFLFPFSSQTQWTKPSGALLLCSISFCIGCIYFYFNFSQLYKKSQQLLLQCFWFGQVLLFLEPKRLVWLKCENKIGLGRKRRKGETESKTKLRLG